MYNELYQKICVFEYVKDELWRWKKWKKKGKKRNLSHASWIWKSLSQNDHTFTFCWITSFEKTWSCITRMMCWSKNMGNPMGKSYMGLSLRAWEMVLIPKIVIFDWLFESMESFLVLVHLNTFVKHEFAFEMSIVSLNSIWWWLVIVWNLYCT